MLARASTEELRRYGRSGVRASDVDIRRACMRAENRGHDGRREARGDDGGGGAIEPPPGNPYTSPSALGWSHWLATGWNAGTGILTAENGYDLEQLTASKQPAIVIIGGRTYLRTDGVDDSLHCVTTTNYSGLPLSHVWAGRRRASCPTNGIAYDRNNFAAAAAAQLNAKITASATSAWNSYVNGDVGLNGWSSTALPDDTDIVIGATLDKGQAAASEIFRLERDGVSIKSTQPNASENSAGFGNVHSYWFMRGGLTLPGAFDWFGGAEIGANPSNADMLEVTSWFLWELGLLP